MDEEAYGSTVYGGIMISDCTDASLRAAFICKVIFHFTHSSLPISYNYTCTIFIPVMCAYFNSAQNFLNTIVVITAVV